MFYSSLLLIIIIARYILTVHLQDRQAMLWQEQLVSYSSTGKKHHFSQIIHLSLLFTQHSLLPDKKKKFPSEDDQETCESCPVRSVEDIPEDIMDAAK